MNNGGILRSGASAAPQARYQTRPFKRILVVDDDLLIRQFNAAVLSRFGYQTKTAQDGAAAWKALQVNGYDLLITDNNMPKVSGVELVKKVRSAHMALPVILASGELPTRELDRNPWLQPVATLAKPFSGDQLLATVTQVLREADNACEQIEPLPIFRQRKLRPPSTCRLPPRLSFSHARPLDWPKQTLRLSQLGRRVISHAVPPQG